MADSNDQLHQLPDDDSFDAAHDFLKRAEAADQSGNFLLSLYLYLAAFQQSSEANSQPTEDAIFGLKQAWAIACSKKERQLAEYIFELMEPYLTAEETAACAKSLQSLAYDKLEEFGLSRADLEEMAQMINEDILGEPGHIVKVDKLFSGTVPSQPFGLRETAKRQQPKEDEFPFPTDDPPLVKEAVEGSEGTQAAIPADPPEESLLSEDALDYDNLAGYEKVVSLMRDLGIGMKDDPKFSQLVNMLNTRHGLQKRPAFDTMLFRSAAREDAGRFMVATLGEIGLPAVNMHMEENFQGMPVLCISTTSIDIPSAGSLRNVFDKGGVLVLEDLDLWEAPSSDFGDDPSAFLMMQMTRGAREAVNLVRSAVENPDVYVLATASSQGSIDEFFLEMLEPLTLVDIALPNPEERLAIWMDISKNHPSIRSISKPDLVKYSANMSRYDIYMAAREAIEEAYKVGLISRKYQPVTRENLFDKLAAYQPLESKEYSKLEDEVVKDFINDLDRLDDLLDG